MLLRRHLAGDGHPPRTGQRPTGRHPVRLHRPAPVFRDHRLEHDELPAEENPEWLAFELHAILLGADTKFVLHDDPAVLDLARHVVRQRLKLDNRPTGGS